MMTPEFENRFDHVIHGQVEKHFPELFQAFGPLGWLWIKAQVWQESRMNPEAVSPVGAKGLLQLMPGTDMEIDGDLDAFDPVGNIDNGVRYMVTQWQRLDEFTDPLERMSAALASYNGGRGYINLALVLARDAEGIPASHKGWRYSGRPAGKFQQWKTLRKFLALSACRLNGRHPDWRQIWDYVERIEERYEHYTNV
jgi:membrane-bound lytic murein transglycosylase MltF